MKKRAILCAAALSLLLTGCASLLEREYTVSAPHSSKFWESEVAGTLRAENYQDIVNDLLLLVGQHVETSMLRMYDFGDDLQVTETLERATLEIQQETPMGAYAVEYITSSFQAQKGYHEVTLQIGYRRSAEQLQAVVNATSPEAIYALLDGALTEGKSELAVRLGYWGPDGQERVEAAIARLREEQEVPEETIWPVHYYPASGPVGLVEILLEPTEEQVEEYLASLPPVVEEPVEDPTEGENGTPVDAPQDGRLPETEGELTETEEKKEKI